MSSMHYNDFSRLSKRKFEATERNVSRAKRSNSEQLAKLNERLGENVGAERERKKLSE